MPSDISVHDFFAAHALHLVATLLSRPEFDDSRIVGDSVPADMAKLTFEIADAMIKEKNKRHL